MICLGIVPPEPFLSFLIKLGKALIATTSLQGMHNKALL